MEKRAPAVRPGPLPLTFYCLTARSDSFGQLRDEVVALTAGTTGLAGVAPELDVPLVATEAVVAGTVPFMPAFCRLPIVCRASRVAARFTTAAAFVASSGV